MKSLNIKIELLDSWNEERKMIEDYYNESNNMGGYKIKNIFKIKNRVYDIRFKSNSASKNRRLL